MPSVASSQRRTRQVTPEELGWPALPVVRNAGGLGPFPPRYVPQPAQVPFHESAAQVRGYGGAKGGGKTYAGLGEAFAMSHRRPGTKGIIFRRTYAELEGNIIREALKLYPIEGFRYNSSSHSLHFANGSLIDFRHCQHSESVYRYQGLQYDWMWADEATQFAWPEVQHLMAEVRATVAGSKVQFLFTSNPGGVGHEWFKHLFILADEEWLAEERIDANTAEFFPARVWDNLALLERDPTYPDRLGRLPEAKRKAYLDGDWDSYEGQFFVTWSRGRHVVNPFSIPLGWPRIVCIDRGTTAPFVALWLAVDPATRPLRVYVYREHYIAGQRFAWHVERIKELSHGEPIRYYVGDPEMWGAQADLTTLERQARALGLVLTKGDNDRASGWELLQELLEVRGDGLPGLQVFANCHNLIRTFPIQVYDLKRPEDLDTSCEDHAVDALRYGVKALFRPAPPVRRRLEVMA